LREGVAQGIGFTLFENVVCQNGRMANNQMTTTSFPTPGGHSTDSCYFEENPYAIRTRRRKRNWRVAMDGPAPAILNAIENATGVSFNRVPLMPEA